MPTLGERLKTNIQAKSDAAALAERARIAQAESKRREAEAKVKGFLTRAQSHIETAILAGDKPTPIQISNSTEFDSYNWPRKPGINITFADVMPEFRDQTAEFDRWMAENGLGYSLVPEHDGVGMESWHSLTVRPA